MELAAYSELIKRMPYKDQAFETRQATWELFGSKMPFAQFYHEFFVEKGRDAVKISRRDVFLMAETDATKAIFLTILWGYPKGYTRPNNMAQSFKLFLNQIENLTGWLCFEKNIHITEMEQILKECKGVGLSTLSKLLYFFNMTVDGYKSLIMDAKIIRVLQDNKFTELGTLSGIREHKKGHYYADYLKKCTELSTKNRYKPDQLELFLFMFGNNLKESL